MTSFAKACIDFSNNLKNLRFSKSSSSSSGLPTESDPIRSKVQSVGRGNPLKFTLPFSTDVSHLELGSKSPSKDSSHENKTSSKKKHFTGHSSNQKSNQILSDSNCRTDECHQQPEPVNCVNIRSSKTEIGSDEGLKSSLCHVNKSKQSLENPVSITSKDIQKPSTKSDSPTSYMTGSNSLPVSNGMSRSKCTEDAVAMDQSLKLTCRFSMKAPLSPTMAHRLAILARNCQNSYGNSSNDAYPSRSYSSSVTSSPIMPHRGATVAAIKQRLLNQGLKISLNGPVKKICGTRYRDCMRRLVRGRPLSVESLWQDNNFLTHLFSYFARNELLQSCLVCRAWYDQICRAGFYHRISFHINMRHILNKLYISKQGSQLLTPIADIGAKWNTIAEWDGEIEMLLLSMLKSAISRHLERISLLHLSDRYIVLLINALVLARHSNLDSLGAECINDVLLTNSASGQCFSSPCTHPEDPLTSSTTSSSLTSASYSNLNQQNKLRSLTDSVDIHRTAEHAPSVLNPLPLQSEICLTGPLEINRVSTSLLDKGCTASTKRNSSKSSLNSAVPEKSYVHKFNHLALRCCSISDQNLTRLIGLVPEIRHLELECCNEITEIAFWTCLLPTLTKLTIFDCINVSDESMGAFAQLLPDLQEFKLQAYHVTDAALCYFTPNQRLNLHSIELVQCMDITNQGIINLAYALPNLRVLNLSGCTKFTDDGLDVICENLKRLVTLDLSWCAKISDSGLECVACDLVLLQKLIVDRCTSLTDLGISHLATMPNLQYLSLRWCSGLSDGSIPHLLSMTGLTHLCLSGCKRISEDGVCTLARHPRLRYLELAHLPAASFPVRCYLNRNLPDCQLLS